MWIVYVFNKILKVYYLELVIIVFCWRNFWVKWDEIK